MDHQIPPDSTPSEPDTLEAWAQATGDPDVWEELRSRIATHDQRLAHLAPPARNAAIVEALLHDAMTDPALASAFERIGRAGNARRQARAPQN